MFYHWQGQTLRLECHLQPNAHGSEFAGEHGGRLKIRIQAPPVEGKANTALVKFIAAQFAVPKARVEIVSGANARRKVVAIAAPGHIPAQLGIELPTA